MGGATGSAAAATIGQGTFQPRNNVRLSEPDIDWTYAVIERQNKETLTTSLLPFNLGRVVMDHEESQNLELQPGDVVTIFSKADIQVPQTQQTRFIRLEGEFLSSGVYSVQPGETLRQLVQRAGGLSPDAYLYGSEFTRESTRRLQQQRLNDYISKISMEASMTAATSSNRSISASDSAAAAASQVQNQTLIASLRQARASGRIVLDLHPDSNQVAELPALPLEDGDVFIVPHLPSTVSVAGAVYNPNSFLYNPHHRVKDYLRLAGGANRDADKSRAYVIRADGSVISKQQISSLRRDGFDSLRVYPGDSVVVPLNLTKGLAIRSIVDIATIAGQFGLAIAAATLVF
jgi:protein involved in polysaccharide export with SLBB domain